VSKKRLVEMLLLLSYRKHLEVDDRRGAYGEEGWKGNKIGKL